MGDHKNKWWVAMIKQYGDEQSVREVMRQNSNKSNRNKKGTGGFKYLQETDPKRLKEISRDGGKHRHKSQPVKSV